MADSQYDCVVIGSGPGGYVAAIRAAQLGMKTAVIEKDVIGGRCLNYACIPAKAVLRVADVLDEVRDADEFGIKVAEPEVDFGAVTARRAKVVKTLTGGVSGLFKKNKIDYLEGHGALTGAGSVRVGSSKDGDEIDVSKCIVLATGSVKKPIPGTQVRQARDRHRGGVGAAPSCPGRWSSSAPARRAPRSPRPTRASASRSSSSRRSTACCRPRTPTSPSSPSAASRSRASRSTPARWSRTSRPATRAAPSPSAARPARPTGSSSPPAAAPTSRASGSTRRASSSARTG